MTSPRDRAIKRAARRTQLFLWGPLSCGVGVTILVAGIGGMLQGMPSAFAALILGAMFLIAGVVFLTALRRTPRVEIPAAEARPPAELRRQVRSLTVTGSLALLGSAAGTAAGIVAIAYERPIFLIVLVGACLLALLGAFCIVMAVMTRQVLRERDDASFSRRSDLPSA